MHGIVIFRNLYMSDSQLYVRFDVPGAAKADYYPVADRDIKNLTIPEDAIGFAFGKLINDRWYTEYPVYHIGKEAAAPEAMFARYRDCRGRVAHRMNGN